MYKKLSRILFDKLMVEANYWLMIVMKIIAKITISYISSPVFVRMFMVLLTLSVFMLD